MITRLTVLFLLFTTWSSCQKFNRKYVGVAFSPYTKHWEGNKTPYWNSYSIEDIKIMLNVINSKFSRISTYGMGVAEYNRNNHWDRADSNCLIARAAAQINKSKRRLALRVSQGLHQHFDENLMRKEIENGFIAAGDANRIYPTTVTSLTFTNEYFTDEASGRRILDMIRSNKNRAHQQKLRVGTRINNCYQILSSGPMRDILADIVKESDFLMCNLYPDKNVVRGSIENAVQAVGNAFLSYKSSFKRINPRIKLIIGETGWPSQGISFNDSPNSVSNLREFWKQMGKWAAKYRVFVQMFEAMDEPWKSSKNSGDQNSWNGPNGAEGYYGFWKRVDTVNGPKYVVK